MMRLRGTSSAVTLRTKEEAKLFLEKFNPSEQFKYAQHPIWCVMGHTPTLAKIKAEFGQQVVIDWLVIALNDYQNFVGVREDRKVSSGILVSTATMIANRYYFLTIADFMLFFQRLKYGDYGEMYGGVDMVRLLRSIGSYLEDRAVLIAKEEMRLREEKDKEERAKAISRAEWERLKKFEDGGS